MKKHLVSLFVFMMVLSLFPGSANAAEAVKEWTFLIFLNGHNNLDSFGTENIRGMEEVGSNDKINIVVQWASYTNKGTQRLLIQKSTNPSKVTSPVVEEISPVDMGDYKELTNFIEWGAKNYPAKHYFVDVWNHGNGWHLKDLIKAKSGTFKPTDISYDDRTGHHITTEELGEVMGQFAKTIGHKVDIYGSDACLMGMAEVAGEMKDSVAYFVGSEEVEPGEGWPYSTFLKQWGALPDANPKEVAKLLARDYLAAYSGGIYGSNSVTMSAFDLSKMDGFNAAVSNLSSELLKMNNSEMSKTRYSATTVLEFTNSDYKDFGDFLSKIGAAVSTQTTKEALSTAKAAVNDLVISNNVSSSFRDASGVAIWLPTADYEYGSYAKRYQNMKFNKDTNWGAFLKVLVQ
jgi:hypothetical protein